MRNKAAYFHHRSPMIAGVRRMERAQKEQERLRILSEEKEKIERKIAKEENDRKLRELRAKLEAENQRKREIRAEQELQRRKETALRQCLVIYDRLKLKRFVSEWHCKARELAEIRRHYRIESNDEILTTSMNGTLALLHGHSPGKHTNTRKRKTPELSESSFMNQSCHNIKRRKYCSVIAWDYTQIYAF